MSILKNFQKSMKIAGQVTVVSIFSFQTIALDFTLSPQENLALSRVTRGIAQVTEEAAFPRIAGQEITIEVVEAQRQAIYSQISAGAITPSSGYFAPQSQILREVIDALFGDLKAADSEFVREVQSSDELLRTISKMDAGRQDLLKNAIVEKFSEVVDVSSNLLIQSFESLSARGSQPSAETAQKALNTLLLTLYIQPVVAGLFTAPTNATPSTDRKANEVIQSLVQLRERVGVQRILDRIPNFTEALSVSASLLNYQGPITRSAPINTLLKEAFNTFQTTGDEFERRDPRKFEKLRVSNNEFVALLAVTFGLSSNLLAEGYGLQILSKVRLTRTQHQMVTKMLNLEKGPSDAFLRALAEVGSRGAAEQSRLIQDLVALLRNGNMGRMQSFRSDMFRKGTIIGDLINLIMTQNPEVANRITDPDLKAAIERNLADPNDPSQATRQTLVGLTIDENVREILVRGINDQILANSEELARQIVETNKPGSFSSAAVYDTLVLGGGVHGVSAANGLRNAAPDMKILLIDRADRPAATFTPGFYLNSRNDGAIVGTPLAPRAAGDKNQIAGSPIGVPDFDAGYFPEAKSLAEATSLSLASANVNTLFRTEIVNVVETRPTEPALFRVTLKRTNLVTGVPQIFDVYANQIFGLQGIGETVVPFGDPKSREIFGRYNRSENIEDLAKVSFAEQYFRFVEENVEGRPRNPFVDKTLVVVGDGDSGKTVIEHLFALAYKNGDGLSRAAGGLPKQVIWYGAPETCKAYLDTVRTRYSDVANVLNRFIVLPIDRRVETLRETREGSGQFILEPARAEQGKNPLAEQAIKATQAPADYVIFATGKTQDFSWLSGIIGENRARDTRTAKSSFTTETGMIAGNEVPVGRSTRDGLIRLSGPTNSDLINSQDPLLGGVTANSVSIFVWSARVAEMASKVVANFLNIRDSKNLKGKLAEAQKRLLVKPTQVPLESNPLVKGKSSAQTIVTIPNTDRPAEARNGSNAKLQIAATIKAIMSQSGIPTARDSISVLIRRSDDKKNLTIEFSEGLTFKDSARVAQTLAATSNFSWSIAKFLGNSRKAVPGETALVIDFALTGPTGQKSIVVGKIGTSAQPNIVPVSMSRMNSEFFASRGLTSSQTAISTEPVRTEAIPRRPRASRPSTSAAPVILSCPNLL